MVENTEEKEMMTIVAQDGSVEEVEVIFSFRFKDNQKEYVIYTKNEKDENENITVYVSNVDRTGEEPRLLGVDTEEEWNRIKDVLRELSKAEFQYLNGEYTKALKNVPTCIGIHTSLISKI